MVTFRPSCLKKPLSCAICAVTLSAPSSTPSAMSGFSGAPEALLVVVVPDEPELHAAALATSAADVSTSESRRMDGAFIALLLVVKVILGVVAGLAPDAAGDGVHESARGSVSCS